MRSRHAPSGASTASAPAAPLSTSSSPAHAAPLAIPASSLHAHSPPPAARAALSASAPASAAPSPRNSLHSAAHRPPPLAGPGSAGSEGGNGAPQSPGMSHHILRVIVHSATHLLPKDLDGASDPYVQCYLNDAVVGRTPTKKSDLNPVFNHEFDIPLYTLPEPNSKEPELKLVVFNEYKFGKVKGSIVNIGKQAFLGQVVLPVSSIMYPEPMEARKQFELQKRSPKSRVRGSLTLTLRVLSADEATAAENPVPARRDFLDGRRRSHYSVGELTEQARSVSGRSISPGNYFLIVSLQRAMELPEVERHRHVAFNFQVHAMGSRKRSGDYPLNQAENGAVALNGEEVRLSITVRNQTMLSPVKISFNILNQLRLNQTLGHANISLGSIPLLEEDDQDALDYIMPVDLFIERRKLSIMPPYLRLADHGSVCRLRLKAWLLQAQTGEGSFGDGDVEDDEPEIDDDIINVPLPAELPAPYEWVLADDVFPGSPHKWFRAMFDEGSVAFQGYCKDMNLTELAFTAWTEEHRRDFSYLIPKSSLVKANHAVEHQTIKVRSAGGYVVDIQTETPEVPFGKDFVTNVQIRIIQEGESPPTTRITVTAGVEFYRSIFLKSAVQSGAKKGMTATYETFFNNLRATLRRGKKTSPPPSPVEEKRPSLWARLTSFKLTPTAVMLLQAAVILLLFFMFLASSRRERRLEEQLVRVNQLLGGQLEDVGMGHLQVPPALVDNIATADEGQNLVTEVAESVAASVSAAISDVVQSTLPQLSGSLPNKSDL